MPRYDYRCQQCDHRFEAQHSIQADPPPCPACGKADLQRLITTVPTIARGMLAHPGDGSRATKEQLQDKWQEETPKLRQQLVNKLGEETVSRMAPTLNPPSDGA